MGPTPAKVGMIMTGIHRQPVLIPDPLEIGDVLCKMLALFDGSGISE